MVPLHAVPTAIHSENQSNSKGFSNVFFACSPFICIHCCYYLCLFSLLSFFTSFQDPATDDFSPILCLQFSVFQHPEPLYKGFNGLLNKVRVQNMFFLLFIFAGQTDRHTFLIIIHVPEQKIRVRHFVLVIPDVAYVTSTFCYHIFLYTSATSNEKSFIFSGSKL